MKNTLTFFIFSIGTVVALGFNTNSLIVYNQDKWAAPASAKELKNPFTASLNINTGNKIYNSRCVICHGISGKGDGPAGKALTPQPTDQTAATVQNQTDGELFWKISEGRGAMVGWKLILSEEERWALVNYIRALAQK